MKAKLFTLVLFALVVAGVSAQRPEAVIKKASVAPVLDGVAEEVWAEADTHHISRPHGQEVPTLGNVGETYWQALWNDDGVYVFLTVTDDEFYPHYIAGGNHWEYDKPELYFDVNYILDDAAGPSAGGNGHHQIAPAFEDGKNDGTVIVEGNGAEHAFLVDGSNYTAEYFVPLTLLVDKDGIQVDLLETVGFDVTINDRETGDAGRRRAVWSNTGTTAESWFNMDDCGYITFDGAEAGTFVDSVHVTGGNITENNGTLPLRTTGHCK
jgi:hypothetical protein